MKRSTHRQAFQIRMHAHVHTHTHTHGHHTYPFIHTCVHAHTGMSATKPCRRLCPATSDAQEPCTRLDGGGGGGRRHRHHGLLRGVPACSVWARPGDPTAKSLPPACHRPPPPPGRRGGRGVGAATAGGVQPGGQAGADLPPRRSCQRIKRTHICGVWATLQTHVDIHRPRKGVPGKAVSQAVSLLFFSLQWNALQS